MNSLPKLRIRNFFHSLAERKRLRMQEIQRHTFPQAEWELVASQNCFVAASDLQTIPFKRVPFVSRHTSCTTDVVTILMLRRIVGITILQSFQWRHFQVNFLFQIIFPHPPPNKLNLIDSFFQLLHLIGVVLILNKYLHIRVGTSNIFAHHSEKCFQGLISCDQDNINYQETVAILCRHIKDGPIWYPS